MSRLHIDRNLVIFAIAIVILVTSAFNIPQKIITSVFQQFFPAYVMPDRSAINNSNIEESRYTGWELTLPYGVDGIATTLATNVDPTTGATNITVVYWCKTGNRWLSCQPSIQEINH